MSGSSLGYILKNCRSDAFKTVPQSVQDGSGKVAGHSGSDRGIQVPCVAQKCSSLTRVTRHFVLRIGLPRYIEERLPGSGLACFFLLEVPVLPVAYSVVYVFSQHDQVGPMRIAGIPILVVDVLILAELTSQHALSHQDVNILASARPAGESRIPAVFVRHSAVSKGWHKLVSTWHLPSQRVEK
jgi:hypothetical protein